MTNAEIVARFVLDNDERPEFITRGDQKHYKIEIHVANAPLDTYAVTYELHETYYDPIRESRDISNAFSTRITSYGDFRLQARLRTRTRVDAIASQLSSALRRGHLSDLSLDVSRALEDIENN
jgi:restriction endonuclease Mrr